VTDKHLSELSFTSLHLPESLARGIADAGFERCTPIQAETLPRALAGLDVAGQAQTGTGKTAAFLVALYAALLRREAAPDRPGNALRALVLAPTRELAVQIHRDAEILGQYTGLTLGLAFGGVDYEKQRRQLEEGVDILIGTPGRIIDYYKQHIFDLRHCQVMVLDEADRMFDLGFIRDIRFLLRRLPPPEQRLSMLFSATLAQRVLELAFEHMNEPSFVRIEPERITAERVRQQILFPSMEEKLPLLVHLLSSMHATRTMVFCNMKRTAERLERGLTANGIEARAMSGDVPQKKRLAMLRDFHEGRLPVLVATDVAARGLHIPDVSHVFNYDLPQDPEDYVHRIGRTARAGAEGDAVSFGCEEYVVSLPDIEAFIGSRIPVGSFDPAALPDVTRVDHRRDRFDRSARGRGGGRGERGARGDRGPGRDRGPRRATDDSSAPRATVQEAPPVAAAAPPVAPTPEAGAAITAAAAAGSGATKRRRRRRGRGGSGGGRGDDQPPTPPAST